MAQKDGGNVGTSNSKLTAEIIPHLCPNLHREHRTFEIQIRSIFWFFSRKSSNCMYMVCFVNESIEGELLKFPNSASPPVLCTSVICHVPYSLTPSILSHIYPANEYCSKDQWQHTDTENQDGSWRLNLSHDAVWQDQAVQEDRRSEGW